MEISVAWLKKNYKRLNEELFDGELGECQFEVYNKGSHKLGHFRMGNKRLHIDTFSRRLYDYTPQHGVIYVYRDSFVDICEPIIGLNGNYQWSEKAALSTLVHEMCHYYVHMEGYYPKMSHGNEFKAIARKVSVKSNGIFAVTRTAGAEQMSEMTLNEEVKAQNEKRSENKKNAMLPLLVYYPNQVRLINCANIKLVNTIVKLEHSRGIAKKILLCRDNKFKELLVANGYSHLMYKYRFWDVTRETWLKRVGTEFFIEEYTSSAVLG